MIQKCDVRESVLNYEGSTYAGTLSYKLNWAFLSVYFKVLQNTFLLNLKILMSRCANFAEEVRGIRDSRSPLSL